MSPLPFNVSVFQGRNLRGEIFGGFTAAVVALPLAMAFGVASGAGPVAGLYGAIFVGVFASLFGGTPSQISGPTGPMTVVMAGILARYTAADPVSGTAIAFTVVMMGGLFQILFGKLRLGKYINLVPHPVISGFMSGIGIIIIILQLGPLMGHQTPGRPLLALGALPGALAHFSPSTVALGIITIAIVYFSPARLNRIIPSPLVALFVCTSVSLILLPRGAVSTLGEIPTGFPSLHMPTLSLKLFTAMVKSALTLALLGSIDSLLTSLVADNVTRTQHDSDRELVGQGIGNMVSGLFGGLPGAGATMRTMVNVRAGGRTPLSGVFHAFLLLFIVLGAGTFAGHIPHVVLAGILIKVGTDIIDWDYLKRIRHAPRTGVFLMFAVLFITVFVDLITSVAVGMIAASLILVHRMAQLQNRNIHIITGPVENVPLCEEGIRILRDANGRILLYHLSGPLSFGAAKDMSRRLSLIGGYDALVLDFSEVSFIDSTTGVAIDDIVEDAQNSGRRVFISGAGPQVRQILLRIGVFERLGEGNEFPNRLLALQQAENHVLSRDKLAVVHSVLPA